MHHLLILSQHATRYAQLLTAAQLPALALVVATEPADAIAHGGACDLAFGEPALLQHVLASLPALHWVQSTWTGIEPLLSPTLRRDYVLTNVRGVFGALMREYVFGYLLAHEKHILTHHASYATQQWNPVPPGTLRGKQLGLLGVGSIGAELARTAKHFELRVKGYTRASEACSDVDVYYHGTQLEAFAADLDYLVSIVPNTADTQHLVNATLLAALPAHALFINIGRGSAVDEDALAAALRSGRLAGAVLDVVQTEPLPPEHPLWRTPNLTITSHTAAPSFPANIVGVFSANYRRFVRGEPLQHVVDFARGY